MIGDPARIETLTAFELNDGTGIELNWATYPGNYMYELWWCQGDCATGYSEITETAADTFTLNLIGMRGSYQFIVRAHSPCGAGAFSDIARIEIAAVPS
jgi:hypothetical protein